VLAERARSEPMPAATAAFFAVGSPVAYKTPAITIPTSAPTLATGPVMNVSTLSIAWPNGDPVSPEDVTGVAWAATEQRTKTPPMMTEQRMMVGAERRRDLRKEETFQEVGSLIVIVVPFVEVEFWVKPRQLLLTALAV
jgi:hypothetical protein